MKVTVSFSKAFEKAIEVTSIELIAETYRDIVSAVINLLPNIKLESIFIICGDRLINRNELDFKVKHSNIFISPGIFGGNVSGFDSLGNLIQFYGTTTAIGTQEMALTGITRRVVESSLFGKSKTAYDTAQRAANREAGLQENVDDPSTGFGSLTLTSINGQNVPIIFGRVRTAGVVIGQNVKHIQRGGVDNIKVKDYIS
jgi:hypothetical protein